MTFQRIYYRQILGSDIRNRTVNLSFPVKPCSVGLVGCIIHFCFIQIAVTDHLTLLPCNHDQTVICHIIAGIL